MFISSTSGIYPSELPDIGCPFLSMEIGLPFSPVSDQLFCFPPVLEVFPNLILLPNLPSNILSPANGKIGWIFAYSENVPLLLPFKFTWVTVSDCFLVLPANISNILLFIGGATSVLVNTLSGYGLACWLFHKDTEFT